MYRYVIRIRLQAKSIREGYLANNFRQITFRRGNCLILKSLKYQFTRS